MSPNRQQRRLRTTILAAALVTATVWAVSRDGDRSTVGPRPSSGTDVPEGSAAPRPTTSTIDLDAIAPTDDFAVAPGTGAVTGSGALHTYTVEVERGLPVDPAELAAEVEAVLADPRGWTAAGDVALQRVGPEAAPTFRVRLATPVTTDARCAPLRTEGEVSCRNGEDVMINVRRWLAGAAPSKMPLVQYRRYVISHEVGHALGEDHVDCPAPGATAPVMLQQTEGLDGCVPNPWPYPLGARPAGS